MREFSYVKLQDGMAKVTCLCGWETEPFKRGPFDPTEALEAYATDHLTCEESSPQLSKFLKALSRELDCIRVWPWDMAPSELKAHMTLGGDEEGIAWIPQRYLNEDVPGSGIGIACVGALWRNDENPKMVRYPGGLLISWAHA